MRHATDGAEEIALLAADVPVTMPALPARRAITTVEQFKAIAEPTRSRILGIIQTQPATAKQIATALKLAPGTVGHHLQVLEAAGLAQVVARRLVRGIVAKYYTRTARIFMYELPAEVSGEYSGSLDILTYAHEQLAEAHAEYGEDFSTRLGFPHARLSAERAAYFGRKLDALLEELIQEPPDPDGQVYGLLGALFRAPAYVQRVADEGDDATEGGPHDEREGDRA